ncbi:MAG: MBL fold metallo-hydrolase [Burkholderiales bacterium]|nr:MBL fold metallo-hydrolase [Burkholderiales bacterium]
MLKTLITKLLCALLALPTLAAAVDLHFTEIAPGVHAFVGEMSGRTYENEGMNANVGFVVTKEGVVVIDSGSSYQVAKKMHEAIRRVTKQPVKYVINTGGQDHRWLGNGYFKEQGATIIAHKKAIDDMTARGVEHLAGLKRDLKERIDGTVVTLPDQSFDQEKTLKLGGTELRIIHYFGGHTPGDSVVWLPQSRVLFSGDLVYVDRMLGVIPVSNTKDWLASFEGLEKLAPKKIVPGHGKVCDLAKAKRDTKDYLALLRSHMKTALDKGLDLQRALDTLDQSRFKSLLNYESLKGGNASRTYLEMETE